MKAEKISNNVAIEVLKNKGVILYLLLHFFLILFVSYFFLPFLNLSVESSYFYLAFVIALPVNFCLMVHAKKKKGIDQSEIRFERFFDYSQTKKNLRPNSLGNQVIIGTFFSFVFAVLLVIVLSIFGMKIFNTSKYQQQANLTTQESSALVKDFDYNNDTVVLPTIDKDIALKLAQARLGDYGSQYSIDEENFTLFSRSVDNETELIRVTPLEYDSDFIALSRMNKGTIGYIKVNVVTQVATLVELEENEGLKYMPTAVFNYNLDRHIRLHYPTAYYQNKYFQLDDNNNPYWVIPTITREIGIFGGKNSTGVITCNPITGELNKYKLGEEPKWIQRSVDERVIEEQVNNALRYKNGYFNTLFTKREMFELSEGYNYFLKDGYTYYVSCVTSPNINDETSVGFVAVNLKTKEAYRYQNTGITETRAREIAMNDERVKAQALTATWPILISYHDVPTYFLVLKNEFQIQKIVFINMENGNLVAMNNDFDSAKRDYEALLSSQGVSTNIDKETSGKVVRIRDLGETIEFVLDTNLNQYFSVSVTLNLDARFLSLGDTISITYKEYSTYNYVTNLVLIVE